MNKLKEIFSGISFSIFFAFAAATPAFAAEMQVNPCPEGTFNKLCAGVGTVDIGTIVQTVVALLLLGAVIIALVFLIYGGIKWILSGGDKSGVESARNTIVGAIIGLSIALAAYFILTLVGKIFGIDILNLKVPSFFQ